MSDALSGFLPATTTERSQSGQKGDSGDSIESMVKEFMEMVEQELQMMESQMSSSGNDAADDSSGEGAQPSDASPPGDASDAPPSYQQPQADTGMSQTSEGGDLQAAGKDAGLLSQAEDDIKKVSGDQNPGTNTFDRSDQAIGGMSLIQQGLQEILGAMAKSHSSGMASPKPINATTEL